MELADEAVRLAQLPLAPQRTIAVLGHEQHGIPPEALDLLDGAVEIPMIGTDTSLKRRGGGFAGALQARGLVLSAPAEVMAVLLLRADTFHVASQTSLRVDGLELLEQHPAALPLELDLRMEGAGRRTVRQ